MSLQDDSASDYGDFIDWESDEFAELEFNSEGRDRYYDGLYYPLRIGEVLAQRYRILHKLGYGGFSTVWMAHDIQEKRDVALKILIPGEEGEKEYLMQGKIIGGVRDTSNLVLFRGAFQLPGHNGDQHRVLVLPLLGPNLYTPFIERPMATRMSAARQLLVALRSLHDAGIVHRDLNEGAVMWEMASLDQYDTATKYRYLGRPQKFEMEELPWGVGELVTSVTVPQKLLRERIYLGDFGMAIDTGTSVNFKVQTPAITCAPERYHDMNPSFASDMWSYMCIFARLYLGYNPFYSAGGDDTMSTWVETLGPFPEHWKGCYKHIGGISNDKWYDQTEKPHPGSTLASKLAYWKPDTEDKESNIALSVFAKVFCYEPKDRLTAAELLEDPSFKSLMAIYEC